MQRNRPQNTLDEVVHRLDYTFIDLPELIDGEL